MSIKKADSAGFCFGVNRAISMVKDLVDHDVKVCTLGPIIHNMEVVRELEQQGCRPVESIGEINEGDLIVTTGQAKLVDGRKLDIREK